MARPKGSTNKINPGALTTQFGPRMMELTNQFLNDRSKKTRQWAWKEMLPYVYQKQAQQMQHTGEDGGKILISVEYLDKTNGDGH